MGTYVCFNTGSASHNCLDDDIFNICLIELGRHCLQRDHTNNTWTQFHAFCDPNNSDLSLEKYLWFIRMSVSIICLFQLYLNAIFSQLFQPLFVKICILYVCVCVFCVYGLTQYYVVALTNSQPHASIYISRWTRCCPSERNYSILLEHFLKYRLMCGSDFSDIQG